MLLLRTALACVWMAPALGLVVIAPIAAIECCWCGRPPYGIAVPERGRYRSQTQETVRGPDSRIGTDTSKHLFQLHGVNAAEEPILRKKLRRQDLVTFFGMLPPLCWLLKPVGARIIGRACCRYWIMR
jgi:transposase